MHRLYMSGAGKVCWAGIDFFRSRWSILRSIFNREIAFCSPWFSMTVHSNLTRDSGSQNRRTVKNSSTCCSDFLRRGHGHPVASACF